MQPHPLHSHERGKHHNVLDIPAAEYVRMSTEDQKYSIPSQQAAIRCYAAEHGFAVCRTYADPGKSGLLLKRRKGLAALLKDVVAGTINYEAVLVYDVSRWGRFQNPDESAHYDFICANAGVPVHYCAEQFSNDGTMQSSLMKAIKRTMAGEFSRELGVKVFDGLKRLVLDGYHAGALAPYGLERMLLSPSGKKKGILKRGERKNLKTDRVVLVRGKRSELECVRKIFDLCANGHKNCPQIAAALNSKRLTYRGKPWDCDRILRILRSQQYLGLNVWARRDLRTHVTSSLRPMALWVTSKAPFKPIIDQATFDRARRILAGHRVSHTSKALLAKLKRVLAQKGRLSSNIIDGSRAGGYSSTYMKRFGSLLKVYEQVGFKPPASRYVMSEHARSNRALRELVLREIQELFPAEVRLLRSRREQKEVIEVDGRFKVSVLLCGKRNRRGIRGQFPWLLRLLPRDRGNIVLICTLDPQWKSIVSYHLVPPIEDSIRQSHCFYKDDPWLTNSGRELTGLSDFCDAVRSLVPRGDARVVTETSTQGNGMTRRRRGTPKVGMK
jgi:DNA invertase Pin-like site-specific DNA recombinase